MSVTTLAQLRADLASYVNAAKINVKTWITTANNPAKVLDKIGLMRHLDQNLAKDKLRMFDGEYMDFGKTIEEWESDLTPATAYDASGSGALTPDVPGYRPTSWSYTLGRKKFKKSLYYNEYEKGVHNAAEFGVFMADFFKKLEDSFIQWRYTAKRELVGVAANRCLSVQSTSNPDYDGVFAVATAQDKNDVVSDSDGNIYLVFKDYPSNGATDLADAIAKGYLVKYDLITTIAKPVDSSTGEAFIEQLKKDVEIAEDSSEGHSFNGNALGAIGEGLVLLVKHGIMPTLDVKTMAGAFHLDKVAIPTEVVPLKDFGAANAKVYAMLVDRRALRLHPTYNATRENLNGDGDFLNIFRHTENTAFISNNAFIKVYKES